MINLDPVRRPVWRVADARHWRLTLVPSVDALTQGRRCHYVVRDGKTLWAADSDR